MKRICSILFLLVVYVSMYGQADSLSANNRITFRGAWIATVANIDWPTAGAVGNTEQQK